MGSLGLRDQTSLGAALVGDASAQVVWAAVSAVLLSLMVVAVAKVVRRLRREAAARRRERDEARRRHPSRPPEAQAAAAAASNGHRPSPLKESVPFDGGGARGPDMAWAGRSPTRIEAGLYDARGRRTADPFDAVRGEMVAYGPDGREVGRSVLELPGALRGPEPVPAPAADRVKAPDLEALSGPVGPG